MSSTYETWVGRISNDPAMLHGPHATCTARLEIAVCRALVSFCHTACAVT
jgi:hypothetical protein